MADSLYDLAKRNAELVEMVERLSKALSVCEALLAEDPVRAAFDLVVPGNRDRRVVFTHSKLEAAAVGGEIVTIKFKMFSPE